MAQAQITSSDAVSGLNPLSYLNQNQPANVLFIRFPRAPTTSDRRYKFGTLWLDTASDQVYGLVKVVANSATWTLLGPGASDVDTLTGDTGGAISPTAGNINILGGDGITVAGAGSTLTINRDAMGGYPITQYTVGAAGEAGYTTIQAALNAANAAGGNATVYIMPGTYNEDLTLYTTVDIAGAIYSGVIINGIHTPPAAGRVTFQNVTLTSATHIFNSAAAGSATIEIDDADVSVTNGYLFNLPSWTGTISIFEVYSTGTTDGILNNTGGSRFEAFACGLGAGTGNNMITSGELEMELCDISCPVNCQTGTVLEIDYCTFSQGITLANNTTGSIASSRFNTGATASVTMNSSGNVVLSNTIVNTSNDPAIDGTGAGTIDLSDITYFNNSNKAATLTLGTNSITESSTVRTVGPANLTEMNANSITAGGTNTNVDLNINPKGTGALNLATTVAANTTTIGNSSMTTLTMSSGTFEIGTDADYTVMNLGNRTVTGNRSTSLGAGAVQVGFTDTVNVGTGNVNTNASANKTVNIANGGLVLGTINVNVMTGAISSGTATANIGTGTGTKTVNVGNTDALTTINLDGTCVINDSVNANTSINTGTSTGTITIGNSAAGAISVVGASTITLDASTSVNVGGNLILDDVATQLQMNGGAATDFIGSATLVAGTVTVANTNILASDRIFIQRFTSGGTVGDLTYTISASTSFTINSASGTDTSTVVYFIVRQN